MCRQEYPTPHRDELKEAALQGKLASPCSWGNYSSGSRDGSTRPGTAVVLCTKMPTSTFLLLLAWKKERKGMKATDTPTQKAASGHLPTGSKKVPSSPIPVSRVGQGINEDNPLASGKLQGAVTCLLLVHVPRERSHTIQGEHARMAKK